MQFAQSRVKLWGKTQSICLSLGNTSTVTTKSIRLPREKDLSALTRISIDYGQKVYGKLGKQKVHIALLPSPVPMADIPNQSWHSSEPILDPQSFKQHSRQNHFISSSKLVVTTKPLCCVILCGSDSYSVSRINNNPFTLSNKEQTRHNFTDVLLKAISLGLTKRLSHVQTRECLTVRSIVSRDQKKPSRGQQQIPMEKQHAVTWG